MRKIKVARIRDIKTELTTELLTTLKDRFKEYGVVIEQVNIMTVIIPRDLRSCLSATTNYDVYLQEKVKKQENTMLRIQNDENKTLLKLKRDNMQLLFKL